MGKDYRNRRIRNSICQYGSEALQSRNQILKAESSSLKYVSWAQDVKLKAGMTYTFSMYVKTEMKQAAEDGGARLRIRYIDKNGKWIYLDSEILKETTGGFVRLYRTFTVPSDSKDPTVSCISLFISCCRRVIR